MSYSFRMGMLLFQLVLASLVMNGGLQVPGLQAFSCSYLSVLVFYRVYRRLDIGNMCENKRDGGDCLDNSLGFK